MFNKDKLGSGALLTALALSVSSAYAQETKDEQSSAEKENKQLNSSRFTVLEILFITSKNQVTPAVWRT